MKSLWNASRHDAGFPSDSTALWSMLVANMRVRYEFLSPRIDAAVCLPHRGTWSGYPRSSPNGIGFPNRGVVTPRSPIGRWTIAALMVNRNRGFLPFRAGRGVALVVRMMALSAVS